MALTRWRFLRPAGPASAQLTDTNAPAWPVRSAAMLTYCRAALLRAKAGQPGPLAEMATVMPYRCTGLQGWREDSGQ